MVFEQEVFETEAALPTAVRVSPIAWLGLGVGSAVAWHILSPPKGFAVNAGQSYLLTMKTGEGFPSYNLQSTLVPWFFFHDDPVDDPTDPTLSRAAVTAKKTGSVPVHPSDLVTVVALTSAPAV